MMVVLLVAGIGLLLAGLVAIGFGIQINEFSLGNTLIISGTVASCTGMLLLGLGAAIKELKAIARRLGPGARKPVGAAIRLRENEFLTARSPDRTMPAIWSRRRRHRRLGMGSPRRRAIARRARTRLQPGAEPAPAGQAAAQPVVFIVIPQGTRAYPGANR